MVMLLSVIICPSGNAESLFAEKRRLLLRIDDDVKDEIGLWLRGRAYANRSLGLGSTLHHTLMIKKRLEAYLALAVAYVNLARFELAAATLKDAQRLSPGDPRIDELTALVAEKQADESGAYAPTA